MKQNIAVFISLFTNVRKLELGWAVAPFTMFVNEFIFKDWHFLLNLLIVIIIDTLLGFIVAYRNKRISSDAFSKVFNKVLVYSMVLIATHTACHMKINGEVNFLFSWVDSFIYSTIVARELLSIFENTTILGYFRPPAWVLSKLKHFNDTGELIIPDKKENKDGNNS